MAKFTGYVSDIDTIWYNGYYWMEDTIYNFRWGNKVSGFYSCPYTEYWETVEEARAAAEFYAHGKPVKVSGYRWMPVEGKPGEMVAEKVEEYSF